MKKYTGFLFVLLSLLVAPLVSHSSWVNNNKTITTSDMPIKKAVCMSPDGGGMYFPTLEEGLNTLNKRAVDTNSMQILYVLPNQTITVNSDITIGEDVSLIIPFKSKDKKNTFDEACYKRPNHDSSNKYTNDVNGPIDCKTTQIDYFRKTRIILNDNVKLKIEHNVRGKNDGRIIVGGEYGECGVNGFYSEITLNKGASIYNGGTLECYGYIKEQYYKEVNQETDERCVQNFHSRVITPMAIYDFPYSGSTIQAIYDNNVCLINSFDYPCIQTKIHFDSYVDFSPVIHIHRTAAGTSLDYNKSVSIINSDATKDALFRYDADTRDKFKLDLEYCKDYSDECTYSTPKKSIYTKYDLYGKVNIGFLRIDISASYTIDTSKYFLPLSYRMNFNVKSGSNFGVGYKVKLLPGASLTIDKGGFLNLTSSMNIYKKNSINKMVGSRYPSSFDDAKVIVNGHLFMAADAVLGGRLETQDLNGEAKITMSDVKNNGNLFCTSYEGRYNMPVTNQAEGICIKPAGTIAQNGIEHSVCHFKKGQVILAGAWVKDSSGTYQPGWKYGTPGVIIPLKYEITVDKNTTYEHSTYSYDIIKQITVYGAPKGVDIELSCQENKYVAYANTDEYIKVNVNRTAAGSSLTPGFNFTNYQFENLKFDCKIKIDPGKAYLLSITEDEVAKPSGRGTVVTTVSENVTWVSKDDVGYWYTVGIYSGSLGTKVVYGSDGKPEVDANGVAIREPIKIEIAANKYIKIFTEYHNWKYNTETLKVGNHQAINYKEQNGWMIYTDGDVTLTRLGGSTNIFG